MNTIITASVALIWQLIIPTMTCDSNLCWRFKDSAYRAEFGQKQNVLILDYKTGDFLKVEWVTPEATLNEGQEDGQAFCYYRSAHDITPCNE